MKYAVLTAILMCSIAMATDYPLQFGTDFYDPWYASFEDAFTVLASAGMTINSVQVQQQAAVVPDHYYWARGDSLVRAAWNAGTEVHFRIDQAGFPPFMPWDKSSERFCDFQYLQDYYSQLENVVERYKPGGLLAHVPTEGVTHFNLMQEVDLHWAGQDYPYANLPGPEMEIEALVDFHISCLQVLQAQISNPVMPFGVMGQPYCENYGYYPVDPNWIGLDDEDDFIAYMEAVLDEFQERGVTPDAIDWHPFTVRNDPLNPGPTLDYWIQLYPSFAHWRGKYYSDRSLLYEEILDDYSMDIPTQSLEGASTPYWEQCIQRQYMTVENHCSFQLSSNVEQAVNGRHNYVMFDLDFDDVTVEGGVPEGFTFEHWWNDINGEVADPLFTAYARQVSLLTGTYCTGREDIAVIGNTVFMHTFHSPQTGLNVYQVRAQKPNGNSWISFQVNTRYLYGHSMLGDNMELIDLGPRQPWILERNWDRGWEVAWFEEAEEIFGDSQGAVPVRIRPEGNPARSSESICFRLTGLETGVEYTFHVYDLTGRLVSSIPVEAGETETQLRLDGSTMPCGIYMGMLEGHPEEAVKFVLLDQ
jgi:hypothetical protein